MSPLIDIKLNNGTKIEISNNPNVWGEIILGENDEFLKGRVTFFDEEVEIIRINAHEVSIKTLKENGWDIKGKGRKIVTHYHLPSDMKIHKPTRGSFVLNKEWFVNLDQMSANELLAELQNILPEGWRT